MTRLAFGALLLAAAATLAACSSTPLSPKAAAGAAALPSTAAPAPAPEPTATPAAVSAASTAASAGAATALPPHLDPDHLIYSERSIYFEFDDFAILPEDNAWLIERHGKYLLANPNLSIRVEGNADERGSAEYNLALGQRRAEAVVKALEIFGVKASQMEAVSWGEERPRASRKDEDAWAENRRADIVYPSP